MDAAYETRRRLLRYYEDEPYYAPRSYGYYAPSYWLLRPEL